jgi:hypothetical protein
VELSYGHGNNPVAHSIFGGKGKLIPVLSFLTEHHVMKAYWESRSTSITPHILDLDISWRWVVSFTALKVYPQGKGPWYPLSRSLLGPQSRSGNGGKGKGKGKVVPVLSFLTQHHAIRAYWRSGGIDQHILDLDIRWSWVVGFTLRPLYSQVKRLSYPLDRRLGGPQSRSGRSGEEKNSHPRQDSNPWSSSP